MHGQDGFASVTERFVISFEMSDYRAVSPLGPEDTQRKIEWERKIV